MKDQADRLREIAKEVKHSKKEMLKEIKHTRIVVVSSGKGGVGKSTIALNLAISLCIKGKKVIIMDADLGTANIDIMLGVIPKYNLFDVVQGRKHLQDIIISGPKGLNIIPGGSGITELANLNKQELQRTLAELGNLDGQFDYLLIDTGAGINQNVVTFLLSADDLIIVTTPEPTSITDAYGLIKTVAGQAQGKIFYLVVNRVESKKEGLQVAERFKQVCQQFLNLKINVLGYVVNEPLVGEGIRRQCPFMEIFPRTQAARNINAIAGNLIKTNSQDTSNSFNYTGIKQFFKKIMGLGILE